MRLLEGEVSMFNEAIVEQEAAGGRACKASSEMRQRAAVLRGVIERQCALQQLGLLSLDLQQRSRQLHPAGRCLPTRLFLPQFGRRPLFPQLC